MYWLERNLSQEMEDGGKSNSKKKENNTLSSSDILGECSQKLSDRWTLDYMTSGCGSEENTSKNSLRRVSFAPCDDFGGGLARASPTEKLAKDESREVPSPSYSDKDTGSVGSCEVPNVVVECEIPVVKKSSYTKSPPPMQSIYYSEPKLPPRDFPPPSPPPDVTHYTRPSNKIQPDKLERKTQSEDDYLSYHIKKKLLALKLKEKVQKRKARARLMGISSSPTSSVNDMKVVPLKRKRSSKCRVLHQPLFHSTPDTDVSLTENESNPTVYYTPKQSFHNYPSQDCEMPIITSSLVSRKSTAGKPADADDDDRISAHSVNSSCSAPSFMISSSTQLCQCIGGKVEKNSDDKFKSLLDRLCKVREEMETRGYVGNRESRQSTCSKEVSSSSVSAPVSDLFSYPKDESSICISSPESKESYYSKDISSSFVSTPKSKQCFTDKAEVSSQGSKLCMVDESWWQKFEASFNEDPVEEVKHDVSVSEDQAEDSKLNVSKESEHSTESPRVRYRKIDMEDLLNRLYPNSNLHPVEEEDEERGNVATPAKPDKVVAECVADSELKDFLNELSEITDDNLTTYDQKEMSLDCINNTTEGSIPVVENSQERSNPSPTQHVSIDMPEDMSFALIEDPDGSKLEVSPEMTQEYFDPFDDFISTNAQDESLKASADNSKQETSVSTLGWTSLSADLITFMESEGKPGDNISADNQPSIWPKQPQDWPDPSDNQLFTSLPQGMSRFRLKQDSGDSKPKSDTSPDPGPSIGDFLHQAQKHLSLDLKRNAINTRVHGVLKPCLEDVKGSHEITADTILMDSLCSATNILEKSHKCLAKSVQGLCRSAIIKQSNVSLELVLPSEKLHEAEGQERSDESNDSKGFLSPDQGISMLNVQLNSSIVYSPPKGQSDILQPTAVNQDGN